MALQITPAERMTLQLLAGGCATDALARRLGMAVRDVEIHLGELFAKMKATSRTEALAAFRRGLLEPKTGSRS